MNVYSEILQTAAGPVKYKLTNDYAFRAVLQESNNSLRHLLAALLNVPYEKIISCEIMNPIILGEHMEEKSCVLDIKVKLNNEKLINLEMQMGHFAYWSERALFYLSRLYCNIGSGEDYDEIMPAIHIGILDQSPFVGREVFYSQYLMTSMEDQHVFNDKFAIRMLCLNQIENVPEAMKETELYYWARLFKATSWEEIKMLIEGKEYLEEAASHLRKLTEEEKIQMQCEMREKYRRDMSSMRKEGREEGMERLSELIQKLNEDGRLEEILKVASDTKYRDSLLQEYGL